MAASESESLMSKNHNWIIQLCEYHAVKFSATYFAFGIIKDAIKSKGSCQACLLDMPINISKIDITFDESEDA